MIINFEKSSEITFGDLADKECFFSDGLLYIKIFSQDLKAFDIDCVKKSVKEETDNKYYKEYDFKCRQLGLSEVYRTKSKSQYEWFLRILQEKNITCMGYMDDWNRKFEIRFR